MNVILVVEDDDDLREAICDALINEGFVARPARNGLEALLILQEDALPDLIILDLLMPTMNGWAFRQQQESDARLAAIPVIVMSAAPSASAITADRFVRKPVDMRELLDRVRAQVLGSEFDAPPDTVANGTIRVPLDLDDSDSAPV